MIRECGASQRIWRIVNGAKAHLDRVRRLAFPAPGHLEIVLAEHAAILAGLRKRDPDVAAAAMKLHLNRIFATIRVLISERRDYFSADADDELRGREWDSGLS